MTILSTPADQKISKTRVLKYIFFVALICWILVSIPIFYSYVRDSSQEVVNKGGTFVEGIFNTTSYLPYLSNDPQSLFYQGLLFRPCLNYEIDKNGKINYKTKEAEKNNLCNVDTQDHKTYWVSVKENIKNTWSDGVPFALEDILFTYKKIIVDNKFKIKNLENYKNIEISQEWNKVKVVFPDKDRDNTLFFTNYILPKHALLEPNINMYQQSFALEPIYNNCARIYSQSTDQYSLIFDLSACENTNIWFYQIKNLESFDTFKESLTKKKSIVDAYQGNSELTGYQQHNIFTDKYLTLFFNTESDKLLVRTRRALWWLIANSINTNTWIQLFDTYQGELFTQHLSKGESIEDFLKTIWKKRKWISDKDIIDSGIKPFPKDGKITMNSTNWVYTYYIKWKLNTINKTLSIKLDQKYDKIGIQLEGESEKDFYYPKSWNKNLKTFKYGISAGNKNLKAGMNIYNIYGFYLKTKKSKLATLQIYVLDEEKKANKDNATNQENINAITKIKIIGFKNSVNKYTTELLKKLFAQKKISKYFSFELYDDENKLKGVLTAGNYDIYIGSINASLQQGFYNFLNTDITTINPSKYNNQKINLLLNQHKEKTNTTLTKEINSIYSKDMPFVILWKEYKSIFVKPEIWNKLATTWNMHEYNRRKNIYRNLVLTKNIYINPESLLDFKKFYNYISNKESEILNPSK